MFEIRLLCTYFYHIPSEHMKSIAHYKCIYHFTMLSFSCASVVESVGQFIGIANSFFL